MVITINNVHSPNTQKRRNLIQIIDFFYKKHIIRFYFKIIY